MDSGDSAQPQQISQDVEKKTQEEQCSDKSQQQYNTAENVKNYINSHKHANGDVKVEDIVSQNNISLSQILSRPIQDSVLDSLSSPVHQSLAYTTDIPKLCTSHNGTHNNDIHSSVISPSSKEGFEYSGVDKTKCNISMGNNFVGEQLKANHTNHVNGTEDALLQAIVPQLKREIREKDSHIALLDSHCREITRHLKAREQEVVRLEKELAKLKVSALEKTAIVAL